MMDVFGGLLLFALFALWIIWCAEKWREKQQRKAFDRQSKRNAEFWGEIP